MAYLVELRVACEIRSYMAKLSDNQVGDRLHAALAEREFREAEDLTKEP